MNGSATMAVSLARIHGRSEPPMGQIRLAVHGRSLGATGRNAEERTGALNAALNQADVNRKFAVSYRPAGPLIGMVSIDGGCV